MSDNNSAADVQVKDETAGRYVDTPVEKVLEPVRGALAYTGAHSKEIGLIAAGLILLGALVLFPQRRRRISEVRSEGIEPPTF